VFFSKLPDRIINAFDVPSSGAAPGVPTVEHSRMSKRHGIARRLVALERRRRSGSFMACWLVVEKSFSSRGGRFHASSYRFAKPQEVLHVPGVNGLRFGFQRTMSEDSVIDGAPGDAEGR
jgi:hypothetical protein